MRQPLMSDAASMPSGQIHLWLVFYDEVNDERLQAGYRRLLNAAELEQESRFYRAEDRLRYLVTRALVRTVLSRYAPLTPQEWVFSTNRYGRPAIANSEASHARLSFNLSHTRSLIVLGVTQDRALGVDVENVRARRVSTDIAHRCFAPDEVAALNRVRLEQRQDFFFEYWTFKESYIKARGMGLSLPLDKFSFHYPSEGAVNIAINPELADDPRRWEFWQFRPTPEYLVAVCAERVGAGSPGLVVRQVIPMSTERTLAPEFLRTSDSRIGIHR